MTDVKLLELLGRYITGAAPEHTPVTEVASEELVANFVVRPFHHLAFIFVHTPSFRKWIGSTTGEWVSQRTVARVFKDQGWVADQGVRGLRVNLWAIPFIEDAHGKRATETP